MPAPAKWKDSYTEQLPMMFAEGETVAEVCSQWNISRKTFYKWLDTKPGLMEAYALGMMHAEAYWARLLRGVATRTKPGNIAAIIFTMKSRFNWLEGHSESKTPQEIGREIYEAIQQADEATSGVPANATIQ